MVEKYSLPLERIELDPSDWLFWKDEEFNNWRRKYDYPRIVAFLFKSLPYFSLWLSEQDGLTEQDMLFHGPSRFIKSYGHDVIYIEHDAGISISKEIPAKKIVKYSFLRKGDTEHTERLRALRQVGFVSYLDWAYSSRKWALPNKTKDIRDIAYFLTPSGRTSETSDYLNSNSSIQLNIPLFMQSFSIESFNQNVVTDTPPRLELLKLGGHGVEIADGLIGEKNLEFTNLDNLTLISPIITSFQSIAFSTLRNFNVTGSIHGASFYQCSMELTIRDGGLFSCNFEYGNCKIKVGNSLLNSTLIRSRQLDLKLSNTEVLGCTFEYGELFYSSAGQKKTFHRAAKMLFSHLGYPDLAGEHFLSEKKSERLHSWEKFSDINHTKGIYERLHALHQYLWMSLQEIYWGYGERPFNIILSSLAIILVAASFAYSVHTSSTFGDAAMSITLSFQSYTNISVLEIKQVNKGLNMLGAIMSFFGLISAGLLVASLSSKTKDYN